MEIKHQLEEPCPTVEGEESWFCVTCQAIYIRHEDADGVKRVYSFTKRPDLN